MVESNLHVETSGITTFDEAKRVLTKIREFKAEYDNDKLALKKGQLAYIQSTISKMEALVKSLCPHDHVKFDPYVETDSGYGLDRHYEGVRVRCSECGKMVWDIQHRSFAQLFPYHFEKRQKILDTDYSIQQMYDMIKGLYSPNDSAFNQAFGFRVVAKTVYERIPIK